DTCINCRTTPSRKGVSRQENMSLCLSGPGSNAPGPFSLQRRDDWPQRVGIDRLQHDDGRDFAGFDLKVIWISLPCQSYESYTTFFSKIEGVNEMRRKLFLASVFLLLTPSLVHGDTILMNTVGSSTVQPFTLISIICIAILPREPHDQYPARCFTVPLSCAQ